MAENGSSQDNGYRRAFSAQWIEELVGSLTVTVRVVHAIIIRESRTRYGSSNLGYTWALIDPFIELSVLVAAFTLIGRTSPIGAPLPVFLLTGIMPFFFWRGCMSRGASAVSGNMALISYPQVTAADIVIGRVILEGGTTLIVFLMIVAGMWLLVDIPIGMFFGDPPEMLLALLAFFYFCLGSAFLSSGLARVIPIWQNVWGYLSRPIWLLSGVFFTLESLPSGAREWMAYNPVAHMIEWLRSAAIPTFESGAYDPRYVLAFATIAMVIGLVIDRYLMLTGDEEIVS